MLPGSGVNIHIRIATNSDRKTYQALTPMRIVASTLVPNESTALISEDVPTRKR